MPTKSPRRQQSTLSSASSNNRTVRAQSKCSPHLDSYQAANGADHQSDRPVLPAEEYNPFAEWQHAEDPLQNNGGLEPEAGPSDYWKRGTPSLRSTIETAPINWRKLSDKPFDPDTVDDGPRDVFWTSHAAPLASQSLEDHPTNTNESDEYEYEKRLKEVMEHESSSTGSRMKGTSAHANGNGYDQTFAEIIGVNGNGDLMGEEEFGRMNSPQTDGVSERTLSITSKDPRYRISQPSNASPSAGKRASFIHPSISRLRSHMRTPSSTTQHTTRQPQLAHLRTSSHFSQISEPKSDTLSIGSNYSQRPLEIMTTTISSNQSTPFFVFHPLRRLSIHLFQKQSNLNAAQVTDQFTGKPTVMDIRGMIAVGTDRGFVAIYGFGQDLKQILGNEGSLSPVTTITISSDQTYIAVGRASGNIHLYDLSNSARPARTSIALTLQQVLSGRREGHLQDSRIIHIGFVGARHTSIVSGDEYGRAFWWSLGKVIGVESNDVVRMLGSYPESGAEAPNHPSKRSTSLFAALPLPLDEETHTSDSFNLSALLTPTKLVIVGMKPKPRTWYRKMRENIGGGTGGLAGTAAWNRSDTKDPVLAYSWGVSVHVIYVKGDKEPEFVEGKTLHLQEPIRALQWYNANHILIISSTQLILADARTMTPVETTLLQTRLLTCQDLFSGLSKASVNKAPEAIAGSVKFHREKLFLLTKTTLQVGTLLHWNDRILSHVHQGDFLSAIQTALAYYENRAEGNTINLPDDLEERKVVVSTRLRELLLASLRWAFSPDRLRDDSHYGQGVDLTGLFEGLATASIEACLSMQDTTFLFDEAYDHFAQAGIQGIFLRLLEPYILSGRIRNIPPTIFQALISTHEGKGELDEAEAVIWNVDPTSLDINQAITLCEGHGLWDAMIHVYTRAMQDYVAPLVKLINVVRDIQQHRLNRPYLAGALDDQDLEGWAPNAYKLYAYVESVLSGSSYPSGEPLPDYEANAARNEVYSFIFAGRTISWPTSSDFVLTSDSVEPPYPYLNLLLRFDTEAFLHSMDIAFEDSYLNDTSGAINRQSIVNLMLDVMDPEYFHPGDITFLHIFVARNLPKYPQFLFIPPSTLHRILVSLASDPDQSTREDRQLAAEYLLSAYTPHDSDVMLELFDQAGFYRILRTAYRREHKWAKLISTLLKDPESDDQVFVGLDDIIKTASASSEVYTAVSDALPQLLSLGVRQTALLLDRDLPLCHGQAVEDLAPAPLKQMAYLRCLLEPDSEENGMRQPSAQVDLPLRHLYVRLLCQNEPDHVVNFLDARGPAFFDLQQLVNECEACRNFEGQLWCLDRQGKTKETFNTVGDILRATGTELNEAILADQVGTLHISLSTIQAVSKMATRLCQEHSQSSITGEVEDLWLGVLHEIIELVHTTSAIQLPGPADAINISMAALRGIVQETLASLVSSSSPSLSFPRLFKRLVNASTSTSPRSKKGRTYAEFRTILTGMLDSYRAEGEMLSMTTRLVEADLFEVLAELKKRRENGWSADLNNCAICGEPVIGSDVVVQARGTTLHSGCGRGASRDACNGRTVI
uniref:Uncharacterized protein n=1 Tax=Kwoniella pini CBS 10737 TaxID=1296096 RepID=A0A1B9HYW2_9TREE|nr:uncharacterized protein I206_05252 [Kwoniella pini CBS 10737]OCF48473.1 hypothetical protein I206_05252 [Kwoniella pini CBS 10737]